MRGKFILKTLVGIISLTVGAHYVNAPGARSDLATHQAKGEVMPFIESISIFSGAPEKENLFAFVKRDLSLPQKSAIRC
jgi:hypothetical protein